MIDLDESALDGYLSTWLNKKYPHLTSPWFQAKVLSVNGANAPYTVTLQRLGEPGPDGGEYVVAPSYPDPGPQVGDNVECCWRDQFSAYVMWPLGSPANTAPSPGASSLAPWQVPNMQLIERRQFTNASSITFPRSGYLPTQFSDYRIVIRSYAASGPGGSTDVPLTFNGDTSLAYSYGQTYAGSTVAGSGSGQAGPSPILQLGGSGAIMSHGIIDIPFATETQPTGVPGRSAFGWSYHIEGWGSANNVWSLFRNLWWNRTTPVQTIKLGFNTNTLNGTARLYGIA